MKRIIPVILISASLVTMAANAECHFATPPTWVRVSAIVGFASTFAWAFVSGFDIVTLGKAASQATRPSDKEELELAQKLVISSTAMHATTSAYGLGIYMGAARLPKNRCALVVATTTSIPFPVAASILDGITGNIVGRVIGNDRQIIYYVESAFSGVAALAFSIAAGNSFWL